MENNGNITGERHNNKTTGVDRDKKSTESGSTGTTDKAHEMELNEEFIVEAERGITEGTDLLSGTVTKTKDTQNKNVIHKYL